MPNLIPEILGALERAKDPRDFPLGAIQAPIEIPPSFVPDMSWFQRNYQGQTPACGPHAGAHLKAILDFYAITAKGRKNPRYGWIKLKSPNSPVRDPYQLADGTDMRSVFKWLQQVGADDYEPLENNVALPLIQYSDASAITPDMDQNASTSKIDSYAFLDTDTPPDYSSLCQATYRNKAVLLVIKCDEGFWGTTQPTFTTPKYGHFVTEYGYDETGIWVVDSADLDDAHALKHIAKEYIQPQFIREAGTAIDLPPSVKQALTAGQISIAQQILADIEQALGMIRKELTPA